MRFVWKKIFAYTIFEKFIGLCFGRIHFLLCEAGLFALTQYCEQTMFEIYANVIVSSYFAYDSVFLPINQNRANCAYSNIICANNFRKLFNCGQHYGILYIFVMPLQFILNLFNLIRLNECIYIDNFDISSVCVGLK